MDYLRNVGVHTLLAIDENHVGDAKFLDPAGAAAAIAATNSSFGCGGAGAGGIDCAIAAGATIADYANNGLTDGNFWTGGVPVTDSNGVLTGNGQIAFPGKNPFFGQVQFLEPVGRSVYNAMQVKLTSDLKTPFRAIKYFNAQISYSLSRYNSTAMLTSSTTRSTTTIRVAFLDRTGWTVPTNCRLA